MKNFMMVAMIFGLHAGLAQARVMEGALTKVELDGSPHEIQVKGSKLRVDLLNRVVGLELSSGHTQKTSVILPIAKMERNGCGSLLISAERNSYDGSRQSLVVIDRSQSRCIEDRNKSPVEIELQASTIVPRVSSSRAFFEAQILKVTLD